MGKAMKIAIVDDEKDMRLSITQWLALSGYDTESFAKAEDALAAIGLIIRHRHHRYQDAWHGWYAISASIDGA